MIRTSHTFSILQAIAVIVALTTILWFVGAPTLRFAQASTVTSFSDTLSDSAPSAVSNHTIEFVTPSGLDTGKVITITFPAGFTGIDTLSFADIDIMIDEVAVTLGADALGDTWGVHPSGQSIDITNDSVTIPAGATVVIKIGTNATDGIAQITNPATATSYEVVINLGKNDIGSTRVTIADVVSKATSADTLFTFSVAGVVAATPVNTSDVTNEATTATAVPFGELLADTAKTAAQTLVVNTNATNGFVVTVQAVQQLQSTNGAYINGFRNGGFDATPIAWEGPERTPGNENEYGHWGLSSADTTLTAGLSDLYTGGNNFVAASTTPIEVFRHNGPTDGSGAGQGTTEVIYKVEVSALQEAAIDYTAILTYIATPVL